jgi:hypothetical protein
MTIPPVSELSAAITSEKAALTVVEAFVIASEPPTLDACCANVPLTAAEPFRLSCNVPL